MWSSLSILLAALAPLPGVLALGGPTCLSFTSTQYSISTASQGATIWIDQSDWPGVHRAALDLQNDLEKVTGKRPTILNITISNNNLPATPDSISTAIPIFIGTIGKSNLITLAAQSNASLNSTLSTIAGKWESTISQVVKNPMAGISNAYAIIGSDKRGTIYGIYDFLEQAGVSPWHWWDDVPYKSHPNIYALGNVSCSHGEPSVKYRGFCEYKSRDI